VLSTKLPFCAIIYIENKVFFLKQKNNIIMVQDSKLKQIFLWSAFIVIGVAVTVFLTNQINNYHVSLSTSLAQNTITSINLSWTEPLEYYAGIAILRSTSNYVTVYDSNKQIASLPVGATSYSDTNIQPNTSYYYTLFTHDDAGVYSDPVSLTYSTPGSTTGSGGGSSSGGGGGGGGGSSGSGGGGGSSALGGSGDSSATLAPDGGTSLAAPYADGTLILDQGTIYVMEYGRKRGIVSMNVFLGLDYKLSNVVSVDASTILSGPLLASSDVAHPRGSLILLEGTVYFLGRNFIYPFPSEAVFASWHNQFKDVVTGNNHDRGIPIGSIVQIRP